MAFDWSRVGTAPSADEFEVTVIGPGFGESVVIHVGGGRWLVVDSCIDSSSEDERTPAPERYLRELGVDPSTSVDLVVATHWHSDHVRGIGRLVDVCRSARFSCANSLLRDEFHEFAEEMSTGSVATEGAKVSEFRAAIRVLRERSTPIRFACGGKLLFAWENEGTGLGRCTALSLSPSDREYEIFLREVAEMRPKPAQAKRAAVARTPNLASVVVHVETAKFSVLLGADMERHPDNLRGWTAAVSEALEATARPAMLLKVPHHGSKNGHHDDVWTKMLTDRPICVVTPFNRLREEQKLPTPADVARLKGLSSALYATAPARRSATRGRDAAVDRGLRERNIVIRGRALPMGIVRFRTRDGVQWSPSVFDPAYVL